MKTLKAKKPVAQEASPMFFKPRALTRRELEVVEFVSLGYKNHEVAKKLGVATKTVETHRANIMNKLALRNVAQLIRYAIQKGIISVESK